MPLLDSISITHLASYFAPFIALGLLMALFWRLMRRKGYNPALSLFTFLGPAAWIVLLFLPRRS